MPQFCSGCRTEDGKRKLVEVTDDGRCKDCGNELTAPRRPAPLGIVVGGTPRFHG